MPRALVEREIAHQGLTELILVEDMHERKAEMAARSDAFIVLPGGSGTLEEFFEQWTWAQIGYHEKPIGLININGYFDPLLTMFDQMVHFGFLSDTHRRMLFDGASADELLTEFATYMHPPVKGYHLKSDIAEQSLRQYPSPRFPKTDLGANAAKGMCGWLLHSKTILI